MEHSLPPRSSPARVSSARVRAGESSANAPGLAEVDAARCIRAHCGVRLSVGSVRLLEALVLAALFALPPSGLTHATSLLETQLTASDAAAGDGFGFAVSLSGKTVVVGAPFDDDAGSGSGGAYVFERDEGGSDNWGQVKKLVAPDAVPGDWFGYAVAIDGSTAAVGAPFDDDTGSGSGAVYLYERDAGGVGNWGFVAKRTAADAAAGDEFGFEVAMSGNTLVVGAPGADGVGEDSGAAYVFERDAGGVDSWGEVRKLLADDAAKRDEFGFAVAIGGDTIAVGAPFTDRNTGTAYVFERALGGAEGWGQARRLRAGDADGGDQFGFAVSLEGDALAVGARFRTKVTEIPRPPQPNDPTPEPIEVEINNAGAVYFFERGAQDATRWRQVRRLTHRDPQPGDEFGFSLAIRGDWALIGARWAGGKRDGRAFLHERHFGGRNAWGRREKLVGPGAKRWDQYGFDVAIDTDAFAVGAPTTDGECSDDIGCDSGSAVIYTITQTREQQNCINALNADLAKLAAAHGRAFSRCLRGYARSGASAQACLAAPDPAVERAETKTVRDETNRCAGDAPDFGSTDAATVNDTAGQLVADVVRAIFGDDLDAALATSAADRDAAKCQAAVARSVDKCRQSKLKEFNRCKKTGLRKAVIVDGTDLEDCWGDDPRGRVAKACDPVAGKLATRVLPRSCVDRGVDVSSAFPGCGAGDAAELARCLDAIVECEVCVSVNRADDLAIDCDLADDGAANASCP